MLLHHIHRALSFEIQKYMQTYIRYIYSHDQNSGVTLSFVLGVLKILFQILGVLIMNLQNVIYGYLFNTFKFQCNFSESWIRYLLSYRVLVTPFILECNPTPTPLGKKEWNPLLHSFLNSKGVNPPLHSPLH